jgi:hypothetical protein
MTDEGRDERGEERAEGARRCEEQRNNATKEASLLIKRRRIVATEISGMCR